MSRGLLSIFTLILLSACSVQSHAQTEKLVISNKIGNTYTFKVEIADDDAERAKGLMNRRSMPNNQGMLFLFPIEEQTAFWMKDTYIPLDMIFIGKGGRIKSIHPMAEPHSRKIIKSPGKVVAGLEINGGWAKKLGLKPGDTVHHKAFGNVLAPR